MDRTRMKPTMTQTQPWLQPWTLQGTVPDTMPGTTWSEPSLQNQFECLAADFAPISLEQMDAVSLLNRIDTKYVLSPVQLAKVLAALQPHYWMLSIGGQRLNHYRTLYFDTPRFELYTAHVNDRPERYKVRSREYTDSSLSFLEVKHRTRKDRTIKERIQTERPVEKMSVRMGDWLRSVSPLNAPALEPKLWNTFTRMTLVSQQGCERVTLDIDLEFFTGERRVELGGIVVAEVKMDSCRQASPFVEQMRAQRICQRGFSKYAVGVAMLYDQVKKNALKPKMLMIEKLMKEMVCND
jgi:hypothetical protein